MKRSIYTLLALMLTLGAVPNAVGDDTDIYLHNNITVGGDPLVMFVLDYRSNLSSTSCNDLDDSVCAPIRDYLVEAGFTAGTKVLYFDVLRAAMKAVIDPLENVKIGFMMSHDDSCNVPPKSGPTMDDCSNGGYIMLGFTDMGGATTFNADGTVNTRSAGKQELFDTIDAIPVDLNGAAFQGKELYFELFRYLTGQGIYNDEVGYEDMLHGYKAPNHVHNLDVFAGPAELNLPVDGSGVPLVSWDTSIIETVTGLESIYDTDQFYISPLNQDCGRIYVINIMFQVSNAEDESDEAITASNATTVKGVSTPADRTKGGMEGIVLGDGFTSAIRWMHDVDLAPDKADVSAGTQVFGDQSRGPSLAGKQNVTSYFLTKADNNTSQAYANAGGTSPIVLADDPASVVAALKATFTQILSVSTTFVSAAIPVNVFNRAEITDNVYVALFQADADGLPRWPGNLKKLKLGFDSNGNLQLTDALSQSAIGNDGRINYDALTFWTDGASLPAADPLLNEVTGRDGRSVARGGAGQRIPGLLSDTPALTNADAGARKLFTEPDSYTNGTPTALRALNADASTATALQADLGAASAAEAETLLQYARGLDVDDIDADKATDDARPWLLEDPLHSRPLPINYGGSDVNNPDIRIVMGTNGGFLHMFRNTTAAGGEDGVEVWGFMPKAVMPVVKRLRENLAGAPVHPYAVDGPPVAYTVDVNNNGTIETADGDKVYVYFGLRRGGQAYYALDISNPDDPKMLWSITKAGDFAELGYTFSMPRIGLLDYDGAGKKPVLVFGGGYDLDKDSGSSNDSEGFAVYVVDAVTGALVWKAAPAVTTGTDSSKVYVHTDMVDSIPSDVTVLDTTGNGQIDRFYVGDTGGVVWRGDLAGAKSTWKITRLASVGRHANGGPTNDRRFFHGPDFVKSKDATGAFDAVIIGSGDRPDPLGDTVVNRLYMIKDRYITSGTPPTDANFFVEGDLDDLTNNCLQDADLSCSSTPAITNGWRLTLEQTGEKSLARPFTLAGTIYFSTYIPPSSNPSVVTCGPQEGSGRHYAVSLQDATAVLNFNSSNDADGGGKLQKEDRFVDSLAGGIPSENVYIPGMTDANGNSVGSCVMSSDFQCQQSNTDGTWRTFWYEVEN